MMQTKLSNL